MIQLNSLTFVVILINTAKSFYREGLALNKKIALHMLISFVLFYAYLYLAQKWFTTLYGWLYFVGICCFRLQFVL